MTYRINVGYRHPADPAAFDEYYRNTHMPIAARIPGLVRLSAGRTDSLDGTPPEFYVMGELLFESRDSAMAALGSPEGQAAAADIARFADGGFVMLFSPEEWALP
ncbi:EthD family reductase [Microbacterium sp. NPDC058062]|uniref:EthD family reductase n=1 Tax=Microbacterium sp. NPDC058062 TaxID=3346320 RepID=UPI0036DFA308